MTEIKNADQLTSSEFKKSLKTRKTRLWIGGSTLVTGVLFGIGAGPSGGAAMAALALGIGLLIVRVKAGRRAEEAFYDSFAKSRGLKRSADQMGPATPLLRKGDERKTDEMFSGQLNPEFQGALVLYTFTEVYQDGKGNRQETNYPFTLVTIEMPKFAEHMPELVVEAQGSKIFDKLGDAFRGNLERVRLESAAFDDRFQVFTRKDQDPVWTRRLFSPSFILYLADHPTKDFAFEFESGRLVAYVPKYKETDAELDHVIAIGCELASKLNAEANS